MTDKTGVPAEADNSDGLDKAETLRGDIRDMMLRELEKLPVIWADLPKLEKNIIRDRINSAASDIIYEAIGIVHSEGAPNLHCIVGKVSFGKGVSVALTASRNDPNRHLLADLADGADVLLVLQDASKFLGEGEDEADRAPSEEGEGKRPPEGAAEEAEATSAEGSEEKSK